MEERDLSDFDKNVMELFEVSKSILKVSEKRKIVSERKNPFLTRLEKYIRAYTKTEPIEHIGYFEKVYDANKRFILLGPQRDNWLLEGNVIITFGEDCGMKTEMKFHLSSIYNTGCKVRDEIREEIEGLPNATDTAEIIYPSTFMLLLYRIFREIISSDADKKKLDNHIEKMEAETGIRSKSNNGNNDLSGIFDIAASMAEKVSGSKIPKDKLPGKGDFSKMLGDLVNDPKTKSLLGGVMEQFKNTDNIGDVVTKLVDGIGGNSLNPSSNNKPNIDNSNNSNKETKVITNSNLTDNGSVNDEFDEF